MFQPMDRDRIPVWKKTVSDNSSIGTARRSNAICRSRCSPMSLDRSRALPSAEQVFADWLRWLPQGIDVAKAARAQIAVLDRRGSTHPDVQYLRVLLAGAAGNSGAHPRILGE